MAGGIAGFWQRLDPKERMLVAVGVPAVAVAALYSAKKGKPAPAGDQTGTTITVTGTPQFSVPESGSQSFGLYRDLQAWLADAEANGHGQTTTPTASTDPCTPGVGWDPGRCGIPQLVAACVATNGNDQVLQSMFDKRVSINDPNLAGTECGRKYALFLLGKGLVPTADNYGLPR